jgi:phospholipid/cholesterol/gamma-HCH transport system substrate-binding protein
VKNGIELHADACLTKTFPSALLPDALLEVQPGSPDKPLLSSLPEPERRITCVREATSVQQLLDALAKIAADVQLVTGDLAQTVTGDKGLREIIENLASASKRIDRAIAENEANVTAILANTRGFTADLREISGRDKGKIGRIATNVEELTARLKVLAASLQEIIDPGSSKKVPSGSAPGGGDAVGVAPLPAVAEALAQASPDERAAAAAQARGVKQAVDKLAGSLDKLDQIMAKVGEGKSVAGRLLTDERLGRKVGNAAEDLSDYYERINKLQIQLQLRSEWLMNQSGAKTYFSARLLPRPDKFYLVEVVADPRGVDDRTTDTIVTRDAAGVETTQVVTRTVHDESKLTFSAQIGKRYGAITLRGGIIESSGGVGADLHLFRDSLQVSASIYQFSRPYNDVYPRAKLWANYYFLQHLFVTAGTDDFLNSWNAGRYPGGPRFALGNDVFLGGGLFFTDDDIKTLLGAGAGSATSVR